MAASVKRVWGVHYTHPLSFVPLSKEVYRSSNLSIFYGLNPRTQVKETFTLESFIATVEKTMTLSNHHTDASNKIRELNEQISLYQSLSINDGFSFRISNLHDEPLATLKLAEFHQDDRWIIETEALDITQAEELGKDLHQQHYQFYIRNGRFRITAWNLLDAHYICNLIALSDLGHEHSDDWSTAAA